MLAKQTFITFSLNAVALRRSRFTPMSKVSSRSSYWVIVLCKRVVVNCQGDPTKWTGEGRGGGGCYLGLACELFRRRRDVPS